MSSLRLHLPLLLSSLLLGSLLLSNLAHAYQVQPMIVELSAQGKNSLVTYRLQNTDNVPLPVEVEVFKRSFDANQTEILTPTGDDFIVLPPQIEVPAKGYQTFRAKYIGTGELKQTDSYRIVFKQLPLANANDKSGVKMMFNFATLVFVSPKNVKPKPQTTLKCELISDCTLTISNQGQRVLDLSHYDYHFNDGNPIINWTTFQTITAGRFIMPGHQVVLDLSPLLQDKTTKTVNMVNLFDPSDE